MKTNIGEKSFPHSLKSVFARALIVAGILFSVASGFAQPILPPMPVDPFVQLCTWSFNDTNWLSDLGYAPVSFTNLNNPPGVAGNALQVDSTNAAWLQYNIFEADGTTNLSFGFYGGTIELRVLPDWNSGTGPGNWGRIIDVGAFSTNAPSSWWSLYFSPDGSTLYFSSETNGVFTNYLSCPISWDTNTWHFIALTYNRLRSALYIDGQLATNGSAMKYQPSQAALTNGFFVGSDNTGLAQSRVLIDDMVTYNYPLDADEVTNDYMAGLQVATPTGGGGLQMDSGGGGLSPPGDGGSGSGSGGGGASNYSIPDYGTNLWIAQVALSSGYLTGIASNTLADIRYEIQSRTDLLQTNWASQGFIWGSETSNWTPLNPLVVSLTNNLFIRLRSWASSDGSGLPDWWELQYFGTTGIDPNASAAGDGYSNLQKFQMGVNPTNYYNPNAPPNFFGCADATGTNVVIEWSPAPGPVVSYVIQRGVYDYTAGDYDYSTITLNSNAVFYIDAGALSSYNDYILQAVYAGGSSTATESCYPDPDPAFRSMGPPFGPPVFTNIYAYAAQTGTNVQISWASAQGLVTNYIVLRGVYDASAYTYNYSQIASLNAATTIFQDVGGIHSSNDWNNQYEVVAVYPGGGLSEPAPVSINTNPPPPTEVSANLDSTGTNILVSWTPPPGVTVSDYVIRRGTYNTTTSNYDYSTIGEVTGGTTSFVDAGAIASNNGYNNIYQVQAVYAGSIISQLSSSSILSTPNLCNANLYVTANLIRNGTGRWQIMFSGIPTNVTAVQLYIAQYYYEYVWCGLINPANFSSSDLVTSIPVSSLTNGIYVIPDSIALNEIGDNSDGRVVGVQAVGSLGQFGPVEIAGYPSYDAPCFIDGRQHLKQNLLFKLRGATINQPVELTCTYWGIPFSWTGWAPLSWLSYTIPSDTNYVESSFLHLSDMTSLAGFQSNGDPSYPPYNYIEMDDLWPITANYKLHQRLYDLGYSGSSSFVWQGTLSSVPASAVLGISDPYWISQYSALFETGSGTWNVSGDQLADVAAYANGNYLSLQSAAHNLFGLSFQTSLVNTNPFTTLGLGSSIAASNVSFFYSQTVDPSLQLSSYYFATVNTPGTALSQPAAPYQAYPLPIETGFSATNQTGLMVASVGTPTVIGGWAKYSIQNGTSGKFAYLGQYFVTNAFVMTNGVVTANTTGVVSPYGDFFPTTPGVVAMVTMPDIDTGAQSTGVGADTKGTFPFYNKLTPNYHTNVVNAFLTAPNLASFLGTLSGSNVVAAHSLGNMVVLSAISDGNAPISQYFMLDAAVPIEAIDPTSSTNGMNYSTWAGYSNRVFASDWYQLFPTNDYRSTLFWNNRLGNLRNVDVYNFYSRGEEVLREYDSDPPSGFFDVVETQASARWPSGVPFGGCTWVWQEKGKGTCTQDWLIGSSHGGWLFPLNSYNDPQPLPPATANALSNATLQVTPVFTFGSYFDSVSVPFPDWALVGTNGSAYAQANRNRILSDAIPALSLPAGANPVPRLAPFGQPNKNTDMMTLENGWPQVRLYSYEENNNWYHSDFHQVAYTFTYKLFNQFVTAGNLK